MKVVWNVLVRRYVFFLGQQDAEKMIQEWLTWEANLTQFTNLH